MKKYGLPFLLLLFAFPAFSQFVHRSTLVGTGKVNFPQFGNAVAISADGNVAVVGGEEDSLGWGAAWVYVRNGNTWTQMGKKLKPNDAVMGTQNNFIRFGSATAISANGNTIAIGGNGDNDSKGAAWVFVRNGNNWVQQGSKLVGTTTGNYSNQGWAVSLSANGNTLLVSGREDEGGKGAVWAFERNGSIWAQQGGKITSPHSTYQTWFFGTSVSLSADGNTALIGAPNESTGPVSDVNGYGYIYQRNGSAWNFVQKFTDPTYSGGMIGFAGVISGNGKVVALGGPHLKGPQRGLTFVYRYDPNSLQYVQEQVLTHPGFMVDSRAGSVLSLSKGGDTLASSGYEENGLSGAVWTFTRTNGTWSSGNKILSPVSGGVSPSFGRSINLSGDGKILIIGRPERTGQGAAFIYSDPTVLSVKEALKPEFRLYPNPVQDFLQLPAGTTFSAITVSDLSGKVLLHQTKPGQRLDLSTFATGIYIVSLQQKDNVQYVRVVKE